MVMRMGMVGGDDHSCFKYTVHVYVHTAKQGVPPRRIVFRLERACRYRNVRRRQLRGGASICRQYCNIWCVDDHAARNLRYVCDGTKIRRPPTRIDDRLTISALHRASPSCVDNTPDCTPKTMTQTYEKTVQWSGLLLTCGLRSSS